ncbi:restriction endonuclease subunit S [Acinetobacter ursingii]|uniref:restriction endonuclease subunit S n=2 Tax=Acinetobacter TaxID=469 RepID=UPI000E6AC20E|nr:restriction endonuclease subunit S [Acinetobacter ursingii]
MSEWQTYKLKDITIKIGSGSTPTGGSGAYKAEGISLIRSQNILDYKFTEDGLAFIDDDQAYSLRNVIVEANDVLLNITGDSVARCCGAPVNWLPARVNQHVAILRSNPEKLDHRFLKYSLLASKEELLILSEIGGTRNALTKGMLEDYEISIPPLPEQKAIASVLSSLDDKIDLLHRQNKTLEAMAETLFRQWFIEEAKEDWVNVQLKDIVKQIKPGTNYQPKRLDSGIPFLNVRNLQNGQINLQGISFISQEEYERVHKAWKPEEGDVLISRIGTLGIVAVLGKRDMPMAVHYNMLVLKPSLTNTAFLYFLLRSQYFQEAYSSKARQSVQEYVAVEDAESIELKLPLNDAAFANKQDEFYCLFDKIRANLYQIQTLENLRDTLLPKLMSGEVRVQYQTEEVA